MGLAAQASHAQSPVEATRQPTGGEYQFALDDLESGRTAAAVTRLRALVDANPAHLGAWLDLAIAHCLAGEADAAHRVFLLLESRADLPPGIAEVIGWYRSGECRPRGRPWRGFVSAGVGWARNVNLAPLSDRIFLPTLGLDLQLADSSLRRDAPFAQVDMGGIYALTQDQHWTLGGFAQAVRYRDAADFNLTSAQATLGWRNYTQTFRGDAQGSYARLWVDGTTRLGAASGNGSALWPLSGRWWAGAAGGLTRITYADLATYDARQLELRGRLRWQAPALRLTMDAGWLTDRAMGERPGGDRGGPVLQWQATWFPSPVHSLDLGVRQTWLRDGDAYSPALFGDTRRAPRLSTVHGTWRRALGNDLVSRVDYRYSVSRDTLPLFSYNAHMLTMSLEWQFGR